MKPTRILLCAVVVAGFASVARAGDYAAALADPTRPAADVAQDVLRKPAETMAFAGIKPGQTIAEFLPGGGYYTRILSAAVGPKGHVYALETHRWGHEYVDTTKAAVANLKNVTLDLASFGDFHMTAKADVFWTTRNYHDLHIRKYAVVDMAEFNRHVFNTLKRGGIYLIVDHDARAGSGDADSPTMHRIEEALVKKEVEAVGFQFVGESGILRNPADDRMKEVFDPSIRNRTDQFILKFRRP